jgi:2-dehydro-3-deoxygalactonokinase
MLSVVTSTIRNSAQAIACLLADWGTTNLRAWAMGADGMIIDRRDSPRGLLAVEGRRFAETFAEVCGDWLAGRERLPVIMSGMVGSKLGWKEVPYLGAPVVLDELARHLSPVETPLAIAASIVPGVRLDDPDQPDVMRGEETQILGARPGSGRQLIVLPGTHCKWVLIEDDRIQDFVTFMTGEMYGALRRHTILARLMPESDEAADAEAVQRSFAAGVSASLDGEPRLMQSLFSIRARGLFDDLAPELAPAYLSGLLIGAEISEGLALCRRWGVAEIAPLIIGGDILIARYQSAFAQAGHSTTTGNEDAGALGLWRIAQQRKLVS